MLREARGAHMGFDGATRDARFSMRQCDEPFLYGIMTEASGSIS